MTALGRALGVAICLLGIAACRTVSGGGAPSTVASVGGGTPRTFASAGTEATTALLHVFYVGGGKWRECAAPDCHADNRDWGVDSFTYALALRWKATHDAHLVGPLTALIATAPRYAAPCTAVPCTSWSDVPEWDGIAAMREYEITRDPRALLVARAAFDFVEHARVFALGACPAIDYQQPQGPPNYLKTLETDANAIKAAMLLYETTSERRYLDSAVRRYAAVRRYFLDPAVPLYTVYVFDDGRRCVQVPHRFFASVNGDMIWSGLHLYAATRDHTYLDQALQTARAADVYLADPRGIFADLQAENDIVEPLVEAMYELAATEHVAFAQQWILRNAATALSARRTNGTFGRFFDGPPPTALGTAWQSNGGLALEIAAAALAPNAIAPAADAWAKARFVPHEIVQPPATLRFHGSAIALIGTLGEKCCEPGHARVFVDGVETFDGTGIWQNKSSSGRSLPNSVLFAWRWSKPGEHVLRFEPGVPNGKEGGSFLHLSGYETF